MNGELHTGRRPHGKLTAVRLAGWGCLLIVALCVATVVTDIVLFIALIASGRQVVHFIVPFVFLLACLVGCAGIALAEGRGALMIGRKPLSRSVNRLLLLLFLALLFDTLIFALSLHQIVYLVTFGVLIALSTYIEPQLADERRMSRELKVMPVDERQAERRRRREERKREAAGLDRVERLFGPHRTLNFYSIFWMFTVWSVIGLLIENAFYYVITGGGYTARYGMLYGPFAPIYGFGACVMSAVMNRYHDRSLLTIFLMCAAIGGFFEFFMSWVMEYAFGISSWDYTGMWLSIGGRTSGLFMVMWGVLGVLWVKIFLPLFLEIVDAVPWKLRYVGTAVVFALMLTDGVMTLQAVGCWYARQSGQVPQTGLEQFYAQNYDDEFMKVRFENMTLRPNTATRDD